MKWILVVLMIVFLAILFLSEETNRKATEKATCRCRVALTDPICPNCDLDYHTTNFTLRECGAASASHCVKHCNIVINSLSYFLEKFVHEDLFGVMCSRSRAPESIVNATVKLFANVTCANDKVFRDKITLFGHTFNCSDHLMNHREMNDLGLSSR